MVLKQVLEVSDLIDDGYVTGMKMKKVFEKYSKVSVSVQTVTGEKGHTDFIKIVIPGKNGKTNHGSAPTLGIVGRLGGIGARPQKIGMVSDGDGAVAALSAAYKLADMQTKMDELPGDVIVTTHICPNASTQSHQPVDFMDSPVTIMQMNQYEVTDEMDAVLSIDTTKGNKIVNHKGISISPTVKEGYILKVSSELVNLMETVTGDLANTFPITIQDITPYGNGVYHLNSILQPAVATDAPVVGVAITTISAVPGSASGSNHEGDIALAAQFAIEVAKHFTSNELKFYEEDEYNKLVELYGSLKNFQTLGSD